MGIWTLTTNSLRKTRKLLTRKERESLKRRVKSEKEFSNEKANVEPRSVRERDGI